MKRRILSEAQREYTHSIRYYAKASPMAARGFITEVEKALAEISKAPTRYPIARKDFRYKHLRVYPFTIYCRLKNEELVIAAISHQKRRPGYWLKRRS